MSPENWFKLEEEKEEAIAWAKGIIARNCRGKAEIRFLKILIKVIEEHKNEDPGTD